MQKHGHLKGNRILATFVFALLTLGLLASNPYKSKQHNTHINIGETQTTKHSERAELKPRAYRGSDPPLSANALIENLPLSFEPNRGQTNSQVKFLARAPGYNVFLTPTEAVLALRMPGETRIKTASKEESKRPGRERVAVLRLTLRGARSQAPAKGVERLPGVKNYIIGSDESRWHTDVPIYGKVRFEEIYPGINLSYYGSQRQLEYDFEVAPGADPTRIRFSCDGAKALKIDTDGDLVLKLKGGELRQHSPVVYQELNGQRVAIAGRFVIRGRREIGLEIGKYDIDRSLIIDPTLVYSTYLGAS